MTTIHHTECIRVGQNSKQFVSNFYCHLVPNCLNDFGVSVKIHNYALSMSLKAT